MKTAIIVLAMSMPLTLAAARTKSVNTAFIPPVCVCGMANCNCVAAIHDLGLMASWNK